MKKITLLLLSVAILLSACTININTGRKSSTSNRAEGVSKSAESTLSSDFELSDVPSGCDAEAVNSFLDGFFSDLGRSYPDTRAYYDWNEGSLFIDIVYPKLDEFYDSKDSLSSEVRASLKEVTHDFVTGETAKSLCDAVHVIGRGDFDVYIILGCNSGLCCASKNLEIFMDPLNE